MEQGSWSICSNSVAYVKQLRERSLATETRSVRFTQLISVNEKTSLYSKFVNSRDTEISNTFTALFEFSLCMYVIYIGGRLSLLKDESYAKSHTFQRSSTNNDAAWLSVTSCGASAIATASASNARGKV